MANKNNFRKGNYVPRYPNKYKGNVKNITYRSSWELAFCKFCDNNANVLQWSSEEIAIPYLKPTTQRVHRYYPDFFIIYKNRKGEIVKEMIEVKPSKQTTQSTAKRPKTKLYEDVTFAINKAKWKSAAKWCKERRIKFRIVTEETMFR